MKGIWNIYKSSKQTLDTAVLEQESYYGPRVTEECNGCGDCIDVCPSMAITLQPSPSIDLGLCIYCGDCLQSCASKAICFDSHVTASASRQGLVENHDRKELMALKEDILKKFGRSLAIRVVDAGSCNACLSEASSLSNPIYDLERFGIKVVASPRHADILLVCGPVTENMVQGLVRAYEAMPEPKMVAAMGSCAISGGIFQDSPVCKGGLGSVLPVDLFIPGCPPSSSRLATALGSLVSH